MNHRLSTISGIYQAMHGAGLVRSKAVFSSQWLMQGSSYLTSMQTRDRQPTEDVVSRLMSNLSRAIGEQLQVGTTTDENRNRLIALGAALVSINACLTNYSNRVSAPAASSTC